MKTTFLLDLIHLRIIYSVLTSSFLKLIQIPFDKTDLSVIKSLYKGTLSFKELDYKSTRVWETL